MTLYLKRNANFLFIIIISLLLLNIHKNKKWGESSKSYGINICSDGRGYYAWLPAIFIYHDLNYGFYLNEEKNIDVNAGCYQNYITKFQGKNVNKYYPGTAIFMLPTFLAAHIYCKYFSKVYPANGYSFPYFIAIGVASIIFMFIGLLYIDRTLTLLYFTSNIRFIVVLCVIFGSNLINYSVDETSMSHVYSFALIGAFVYYTLIFSRNYNKSHFWFASFLIGWIFVTRPVNITILLLLPFIFWNDINKIISYFRSDFSILLIGALCASFLPFMLLFSYKISTGSFLVYSYSNEKFNFLDPNIIGFLFSYTNGMVLYMPLLFVSIFIGIFSLSREILIKGIILTLVVTIYIHASWWCWYYGRAFGSRTLLDFMSIFAILMAYNFSLIKTKFKRGILIIITLICISVTMVLYKQRHSGKLAGYPISDYKEALWEGFGLK